MYQKTPFFIKKQRKNDQKHPKNTDFLTKNDQKQRKMSKKHCKNSEKQPKNEQKTAKTTNFQTKFRANFDEKHPILHEIQEYKNFCINFCIFNSLKIKGFSVKIQKYKNTSHLENLHAHV